MTEEEVARLLSTALARHRAGAHREALADYGRVLAAHPEHPDALNLAASALRSSGDLAGALGLARRAAAAAPDRADVAYNLGNALSAAGALVEAAAAFEHTLDLDPTHAEASANLGIVHARRGDVAAAGSAYRRALAIDPDQRIAGINLANLLGDTGRTWEATDLAREMVRRHPGLAEAHYDLSLLLFRRGDWATAAAEYEWRWKTAEFSSPVRHADLPDWDGTPFRGRLLVHAEQGLGDTIQFARLLPLAASLGMKISFEVPTVLVALLSGIAGADLVGDRIEAKGHAAQTPLLGLIHRLRLTLGSFPAVVPYLSADPKRVVRWRERLAPDGAPIVGVGWRGNPNSPADRGRSLASLAALAPLADSGRRLIALQKLDRSEIEAAEVPTGWRVAGDHGFLVEHPGPTFDIGRDAFLDTAAVMMSVDRVVSVDTSLVHLAGALGRPTSVLLKRVADWRWLEGRDDCPAYPTMRLHRQQQAGDYTAPIEAVAALLAAG